MAKQGPAEELQLIKDFLREIVAKVGEFFNDEPGEGRGPLTEEFKSPGQNGASSPIKRMQTRMSNLSNQQFFGGEDPDRANFMQKSVTILDQLNKLERRNLQLSEELEQKNKTIQLMEERQASLLEEKASLEQVLGEIDEAGKHEEFEEYQERLRAKFKEDLQRETEELRMKIGELEHAALTLDVDLQKARKGNAELRREVEEKAEAISNYGANYVPRDRFELESSELAKAKNELSKLANTITFRDLRVGELEAKLAKSEEGRRRDAEVLKKKADEKYDEARRKWQESREKLKGQVAELSKWKAQHFRGDTVDPAQVWA